MAATPNIPDPVVEFIRVHIHSVLQLEMLLWLKQNDGAFSASEIAAELRITERSAEIRLQDLVLRDLAIEDGQSGRFRYRPKTGELSKLVDALEDTYALARYSVINLIFSMPGDSARSLAEAFRFRKKKED